LKSLIKCGITLRKYEKDKQETKLQDLRLILKKKSLNHLWFSQLVQSGLLSKFIIHLSSNFYSFEDIEKQINLIFEKIGDMTYFIREIETKENILKEITNKFLKKPEYLFISSKFEPSIKLKKIEEKIIEQCDLNYFCVSTKESNSLLLFFILRI
jgi:hypothetical protein